MKLFVVLFCVATSLLAVVQCQITANGRPVIPSQIYALLDNLFDQTGRRTLSSSEVDEIFDTLFPDQTELSDCDSIGVDECEILADAYPANLGLTADFNCNVFLGLANTPHGVPAITNVRRQLKEIRKSAATVAGLRNLGFSSSGK